MLFYLKLFKGSKQSVVLIYLWFKKKFKNPDSIQCYIHKLEYFRVSL